MKTPGLSGKPAAVIPALIALIVLLTVAFAAPAWCSSGGEAHGTAVAAEGAEGGHGAGEAAAEGHGAGAGPHWTNTDWYRVMNFAVLAIALFLVLRKPAAQALSGRIKGIKEELSDLEARKADVEKQLREYNDKLTRLDKEAEQIIAEYVRQGEESRVRILKEAQAAAEKLQEQAQKNIEHEFKQARQQLQADIAEKALAQAEKVIKSRITPEDQNRLVDEYLNKVVA